MIYIMKDPILYLSIFLALAGIFTLINTFADDDDDSDGDGGKYILNLEYAPIKSQKSVLLIRNFNNIIYFYIDQIMKYLHITSSNSLSMYVQ